jgi:hypothetical protein
LLSTPSTPLLGFISPSALSGSESTSCLLGRSPGLGQAPWLFSSQESADKSHLASYGAALRLSQPLSDFFPRPPSSPFSDELRSWGLSLQGLV